jgi:hypothetical protein
MSSNRRLKQSRTRDEGADGPLDREEEQESAGRGAQSGAARARCPVVPKIKFATDSSLEGGVCCEPVSESAGLMNS